MLLEASKASALPAFPGTFVFGNGFTIVANSTPALQANASVTVTLSAIRFVILPSTAPIELTLTFRYVADDNELIDIV